jgi:hypothetical protein
MKKRLILRSLVLMYYAQLAVHFVRSPKYLLFYVRHPVNRRCHRMISRRIALSAADGSIEELLAELREMDTAERAQ